MQNQLTYRQRAMVTALRLAIRLNCKAAISRTRANHKRIARISASSGFCAMYKKPTETRNERAETRNERAARLQQYRAEVKDLLELGFGLVRVRADKSPVVRGKRLLDSCIETEEEVLAGEYVAAVHSLSNLVCIDVDTGKPAQLIAALHRAGIRFVAEPTPRGGWHYWIHYINAAQPAAKAYRWRGLGGEVRRGASYTVIYHPRIIAQFFKSNKDTYPAIETVIADLHAQPVRAAQRHDAAQRHRNPQSVRPRHDAARSPSAQLADSAVSNAGLYYCRQAYTETLFDLKQSWRDLPYASKERRAAQNGHDYAVRDIGIAKARAADLLQYFAADLSQLQNANGKQLRTTALAESILQSVLLIIGREGIRACFASYSTIAEMADCSLNSVRNWMQHFADAGLLQWQGYKKCDAPMMRKSPSWCGWFRWYRLCRWVLSVRTKDLLGLANWHRKYTRHFFADGLDTNRFTAIGVMQPAWTRSPKMAEIYPDPPPGPRPRGPTCLGRRSCRDDG